MAGETTHDPQKLPLASGDFAGRVTAPALLADCQPSQWKAEPVWLVLGKPRAIQWKSHCFCLRQQEEKPGWAPRIRNGQTKLLAPKLRSSRELFQQKRKSSSHLSVLQHLDQKAGRGILNSKATPGRPASASHHHMRAINTATQQTQQDRAQVVIATTSCIYISPSIHINSREGKQAGLKSKRCKAASPLEILVEPNPVVPSCSPSPELAARGARGRHSALAWPHLRSPRISCYMHCITHRSWKHLT